MAKYIYGTALLLIIGWAAGIIGFHAGNWIHLLMVGAIVLLSLNVIREG